LSLDAPSEFVAEAQEVIETFSAQLLEIESALRRGADEVDPGLVNGAFRAVHSLKGLAALSGEEGNVRLAHALESTLDDLRLGRRDLGKPLPHVLFECVETSSRLLARSTDPGAPAVDVTGLLRRVTSEAQVVLADVAADAWLDTTLLGVLTEYEEHRLRENLRLGRRIYRVHADFDLMAIDVGIESLKGRMKAYGEIITYLPSAESASEDRIELDILLGSRATLAEVAAGVGDSFTVHELGPAKPEVRAAGDDAAEPSLAQPSFGPAAPAPARADTPPVPTSPKAPPAQALSAAQGPESPGPASSGPASSGPAASGPAASRRVDEPRAREGEGVEASEGDGGEQSLRSLSQTVRVDLRRLDHLMNLVGELGLVHTNLRAALDGIPDSLDKRSGPIAELVSKLDEQVRLMSRRLAMLQEGILDVRMVPLGQIFDKLARVVRKLGREAGKDVRLTITGADTELDKLIVEELSEDRHKVGKPEVGTIALNAFQKGNHVVIEVEDDGRGMDPKLIIASAIRKGIITEDESREMSARDAYRLVFMPGFSTKTVVTDLSGRGVGLDVVKTNIAKLGGIVDITSEVGTGTKMTITLPVTLAIINVLIVEIAGRSFAIPLASVEEAFVYDPALTRNVEGREVLSLRGQSLPICHLSSLFQVDAFDDASDASRKFYVVTVAVGIRRLGVLVDRLEGQQDIVIKPLGRSLKSVRGFAGAAELGDQRVALVLDVAAIVEEVLAGDQGRYLSMAGDGRG